MVLESDLGVVRCRSDVHRPENGRRRDLSESQHAVKSLTCRVQTKQRSVAKRPVARVLFILNCLRHPLKLTEWYYCIIIVTSGDRKKILTLRVTWFKPPPDLHPYGLCNRLMRCNLPSDDSTLLNVSATPALGVGCKNVPLRLQIANLYPT